MTVLFTGLVSVLFFGACGDTGPAPPGTGSDARAEIATRISAYLEAIEQGDPSAAGEYWTADARLIGPGMDLDRGAIVAGIESAADAGTEVEVLERETLELHVHGDAAYEIARAVEVFTAASGTSDTARNNLFVRWEKGDDGAWRLDRALLGPRQIGDDVPVDEPARLEAILEDIRVGWEQGDGAPFHEHFLDWAGARYFEGGGQNVGLRDLVENHVEPEAELGLRLGFSNIQTHFEGDFAWAVVDTDIRLTTRDGREIHNRGHATYLFRWVDGAWKVVHTQSASRPVRDT